jgi:uncharacterized protein
MIEYEWDEEKCQINIQKHTLDFRSAWRVFESAHKVTFSHITLSEIRYTDMAMVDEKIYLLVYTIRGDKIRIISYRRAKAPKETQRFESIMQR